MRKATRISLSISAALFLLSSITANAVLNMGGKTIFTGTLIEVLEPGSATRIQDIISNISDASAAKPYLIHLGAGVYDLGSTNIVMKEWISIQGSGQQITKITAEVSTATGDATSAVLVGVNNVSLADLTIEGDWSFPITQLLIIGYLLLVQRPTDKAPGECADNETE